MGRKRGPWVGLDDGRSLAGRGAADLVYSPHVIEAVLDHFSGHRAGVAGIYNRSIYAAEKRMALVIWAHHLTAAIEKGA